MTDKLRVLSYGAGVNSTAILALIRQGKIEMPGEIIFCDTGAEHPDTYCYLNYIKKMFPRIETVRSVKGSIIDYCKKYKIIPSRQMRWCTDKYKIRPYNKRAPEGHIKILGIAYEEQHRVRDWACEYPLIDLKINRHECIRIIQRVGWQVPRKSGCFICPFMRKSELRELASKWPEQFDILVDLEAKAHKRNNKIYFREDRLITDYVADSKQETLDGFENYQHCLCKSD